MINATLNMKHFVLIASLLVYPFITSFLTISSAFDIVDADIFIDVKVIHSTQMSTISEFSIDNGIVTGCFMEREAGTEKEEKTAYSKKRIPPGTYELIRNDCSLYKNRPPHRKRKNCAIELRLKTKSVTKGISRDGVLIHIGNFSKNTSGCLLPGESYKVGEDKPKLKLDKKTRKYYRNVDKVDIVYGSKPKLQEIIDYINKREEELKALGKSDIVMKIRLR